MELEIVFICSKKKYQARKNIKQIKNIKQKKKISKLEI